MCPHSYYSFSSRTYAIIVKYGIHVTSQASQAIHTWYLIWSIHGTWSETYGKSCSDYEGGYRPGSDYEGGYRPGSDYEGGYRPGSDHEGGYRPGYGHEGGYRPGSDKSMPHNLLISQILRNVPSTPSYSNTGTFNNNDISYLQNDTNLEQSLLV